MTEKELAAAEPDDGAEEGSGQKARGQGGSSISRALDVIMLFTADRPRLRAEEVMTHLGCSQASAYRYIEVLCDAEMLSPIGGGYYSLGPRVIELDHIMRMTDPMLRAGREVLPTLAREMPNTVMRLCSLYRDKVICVHTEGPETIDVDRRPVPLVHNRGVPLPLFRNAASLAILAFLPPLRIRNIYLDYAEPIRAAGLGQTWKEFRTQMTAVKRRGFTSTSGRNNPLLAAVSVPILPLEGAQNFGSLTRVLPRDWYESADVGQLVDGLRAGADRIRSIMEVQNPAPSTASPSR